MTSGGTEFGVFRDINTSLSVSRMVRKGQKGWKGDIEAGSNQVMWGLLGLGKEPDFILSQGKGIEGF